MLKSRQCRWVYARTGRGAVALFDVRANEELHALLNGWAEIIPAQDRKSTRLNSSHIQKSRMPSSA